jgi:hypothetical protein
MVAPLLAFLLLPPGHARRRSVRVLSLVAAATPLFYGAVHRIATVLYSNDDTLRTALSGLRAWRRMGGIVWELVQFGTLHLLMGPIRPAVQLPGWLAPTVCALVATGLLLVSLTTSAARRRQIAGALALTLSCYALIAAGRTHMMAPGAGLEAAQLRYHYVATLPLILALCIAAREVASRLSVGVAVKNAALAAYLAVALLSYAWLGPRLVHQDYARREVNKALSAMRAQIAAQPSGATVTIANRSLSLAVSSLWNPRTLFPGWAGLFMMFFPENVVDGRRVVFTDPDPKVVAAHALGRSASLIILGTPVVPRATPLAPRAQRPPRPATRALPVPSPSPRVSSPRSTAPD